MILLILSLEISEESEFILVFPGLSLLGPGVRGRGLPPTTMSMTPIYFRLRVVPHLSSGIVERVKRERA